MGSGKDTLQAGDYHTERTRGECDKTKAANKSSKSTAHRPNSRYRHAYLTNTRNVRLIFTEEAADLYLQSAKGVGKLLGFTGICLGHLCVHVAYIVRDGFRNGLGTLALVAVLDHLGLRIRQGDADPSHGRSVAHQCLAHEVGNAYRILARSAEATLLDNEVVHGGQQRQQSAALTRESGQLLQTAPLYRTAHNAKFRLGRYGLVHRFRVSFRGVHALTHHGRQLGLRLRCRIALGDERLHGTGKLLKAIV